MTGIVTLKNGWLWQCFCSNLWSLYVSNGSYIWRHQRHALLGVSIKSTAAEGRPRVTLTWKVWAFCGNDTWEMFDAQSFSDVLRCHLEGFSQWAMLFFEFNLSHVGVLRIWKKSQRTLLQRLVGNGFKTGLQQESLLPDCLECSQHWFDHYLNLMTRTIVA